MRRSLLVGVLALTWAGLPSGAGEGVAGPAAASVPGTLSAQLGPSTSDQEVGPFDLGTFPDRTLVDIEAAGILDVYRLYPPEQRHTFWGQLDPGGVYVPGQLHCVGNVAVTSSRDNYIICDEGNAQPLQYSWSQRKIVQGTVRARRNPAGLAPTETRCDRPGQTPCFSLVGTQTVTVTRVADQLWAYANPFRDIPPGTTVTFTAATRDLDQKTPLEIQEWIWVARRAPEPRTRACGAAAGQRQCSTAVHESGTMFVRALVNGVSQQAGATVTVQGDRDELLVSADKQVVCPGTPVTFTATTASGRTPTVLAWTWQPSAGGPPTSPCGRTTTCSMTVREGGTMTVTAAIDDEPQQAGVMVRIEHGSLAVLLELDRRDVWPVLARTFDATTQEWEDASAQWNRRTDVVSVLVRAGWPACMATAEDAEVTLVAAPVAGSGGHNHLWPGDVSHPRPTGTFYPAERADDAQKDGPREGRGVFEGRLDAAGEARVVYRTSGVAGIETITATVTALGMSVSSSDAVVIRFPGLVPVPRTGLHYVFTPQDPGASFGKRHGDTNHWAWPLVWKRMERVFEKYLAEYPDSGPFQVTDVSLFWGGLHDVGQPKAEGKPADPRPWKDPHALHRTGVDVDLGKPPGWAERRSFLSRLCRARCLIPEDHGSHLHVRPFGWLVTIWPWPPMTLCIGPTRLPGVEAVEPRIEEPTATPPEGRPTLSPDPVRGGYLVRYRSEASGRDETVEITPPDGIEPRLVLARGESTTTGEYRYAYRLENEAGARASQPLQMLELPCPPAPQVHASAPEGWIISLDDPVPPSGTRDRCIFFADVADAIPPGGAIELEVASAWLPRLVPASFWGFAPPAAFSSEDHADHTAEIHDLIGSVDGTTGGWVTAPVVAPVRDPTGLAASTALSELLSELDGACATPSWIPGPGACDRLRRELAGAARSLAAGDSTSATRYLQAFRVGLLGARDRREASESAYWLLDVNAEFVSARVGGGAIVPW